MCQRKCAYPVLDDPHAGRNQAFFFKHRLHLLVSGLVGQVANVNGAVRGRRRMREIGLELCLALEFANKTLIEDSTYGCDDRQVFSGVGVQPWQIARSKPTSRSGHKPVIHGISADRVVLPPES